MISIIVHSGEWDRIYHAFSMASTYSALGEKVSIFLTYWAIDTVVRDTAETGDERKDDIIKKAMDSGKMKSLGEMIELGKQFGNVEIVVCSGSLDILGYSENDLPEWVDRVGGLAEQLMTGEKVIFI
ncbi:DsrE family protein [Geoglobus acetivorans]|uniref:DsrE family protein n=1 Tax=Geoglobus acetivorans TaxID=565033 RepID=A0ABZ3H2V0_GEOAI|nr:DsrE family protein [Geoglobus acetivorans]